MDSGCFKFPEFGFISNIQFVVSIKLHFLFLFVFPKLKMNSNETIISVYFISNNKIQIYIKIRHISGDPKFTNEIKIQRLKKYR